MGDEEKGKKEGRQDEGRKKGKREGSVGKARQVVDRRS